MKMQMRQSLAYALVRRHMSTSSARAVKVHEVSPRDGLQNEKAVLPTATKLKLLKGLVASNPSSIEVTSFVRAEVIPALADADDLCARLWEQPWAADARNAGIRFAVKAHTVLTQPLHLCTVLTAACALCVVQVCRPRAERARL